MRSQEWKWWLGEPVNYLRPEFRSDNLCDSFGPAESKAVDAGGSVGL